MSFLDSKSLEYQRVDARQLYNVRQVVLRPRLLPEMCGFDGDDDADTQHFAAICDGAVIGVLTALVRPNAVFENEKSIQFRGMAVLPDYRRFKVGASLLTFGEEEMRQRGINNFWLNARANAIAFYAAQGYEGFGEHFEIPNIGSHLQMRKTTKRF